ncbi:T9SS type A sorting domain-containing protein [Flavobacterium sp. N502540]|uniref:T9SS type A sorting domain-containing protein n=1 Tax=Flavobacterium sp. N502540 TaxID=2986838 RepID=UPI002224A32A|nr:T9SS type A sorting domain-containing protein [Flavobacterium sp. N502540]
MKNIFFSTFSIAQLKFIPVLLLLNFNMSFSQSGPYSYFAPYGNNVFTSTSKADHNSQFISADQLDNLSQNTDGLVIIADFEAPKDGDRLLSFESSKGKFLEIFYQDQTMMLRRYHENGTHFDYLLFDPLFTLKDQTPVDAVWTVRYFFTARFMWIEVQIKQTPLPTTTQYLSATYFGLDYKFNEANSPMNEFLNRSATAKITFGSNTNNNKFKIPAAVKIHEFNYSELKDHVQTHFSYPKKGNNTQGKREVAATFATPDDKNNEFDKVKTEGLETNNDFEFKVYPNPSKDYFNIEINSNSNREIKIQIFDMQGKKLYSETKNLNLGYNKITINHSDIRSNSDVMILKITSKETTYSYKLLHN